MNSTAKNILIFVAGALTGASVSTAVLYSKFKRKSDKDFEVMQQFYENRMGFKFGVGAPETTSNYEANESIVAQSTNVLPPKVEIAKVDYSKCFEIKSQPIKVNVGIDMDNITVVEEEDDSDHPFPGLITENDFYESDYENVEYVWTKDKCLISDEYDIIPDPENVIGYATVKRCSELENGWNDCIYAKNPRLRLDYIIVYEDMTAEEYLRIFAPSMLRNKELGDIYEHTT